MVSEETVRTRVSPETDKLIEAPLAEDDEIVRSLLAPGSDAAHLHHLFGCAIFDLLLKTMLGREHLGLTRAIETEKGKRVNGEFVWLDPRVTDGSYTAADVVSAQLRRKERRGASWL